MRLRCILLLSLPLLSFLYAHSRENNPEVIRSSIKISELRFIENKAQWDARVLFQADLPIGSLFLEKSAFTYVIVNKADLSCCHRPDDSVTSEADHVVNMHAYKVNFLGANENVIPVGGKNFPEYYNFFLGNDPSKWASHVQLYRNITYPSLYPGIDLYVGDFNMNLKYEFRIQAGADPSDIKLRYEGIDGIEIRDGNLVIKTSVNDILEQKPYAYQVFKGDTLPVRCMYDLKKQNLRFLFPDGYRHDLPLVIDPVVVGATYAGSVGSQTYGHSATYDEFGNIYMAGRSFGPGYPATPGSFQTTFSGVQDVGISKMNPSATTLLWATYIGGTKADNAHSLIVNENHELFAYGSTESQNFPTTTGCFDNSLGGDYDIFLAHLSNDGSVMIGSTYVGGSGIDGQNAISQLNYPADCNYGDDYRGEIILDTAGNPCVASFSRSNNFPVTPGVYDNTYNGQQDGVVFKMNDSLTSMIWATYIGGSGNDAAYGIKLNSMNEVYVAGGTNSLNFPTWSMSYKSTYQGGTFDGFITIFSADVAFMPFSTYFGTDQFDECFFIQMNDFDEVFVYGQTKGNIPISPGCYGNVNSPQFIAKLDFSLSDVMWSTTFGSGVMSARLSPTAFLVDLCDNIYAAGWGNTTNYPVSPDAVQSTTLGSDFYIIALEANALQLSYATYYGAPDTWEHVDGGTSRFDKYGKIYEAVCEGSATSFPTTPGAYRDYKSVPWELAVFVIDFELSGPTSVIDNNGSGGGCAPYTASFTNTSLNATDYLWDFGDGSPMVNTFEPGHTFLNPGTYQVACIAIDSASCFISDTSFVTVTVIAPPVVDLGPDTLMCGNLSLVLDAGNTGSAYLWSTAATTQQITINTAGTYWASVNNGQCLNKDTIVVTYMPQPNLGNDTALCTGLNLVLSSGQPGYVHSWSTGASSQTINVTSSDTYWVGITQQSCTLYDTIIVSFIPLPVVELGPMQSICEGSFTTLDAGNPGSLYHWSTGANTQQIQVGQAGMFHVTVTSQGCSSKDSVQVNTMMVPVVNLLGDRHLCQGETLYLDAGNPGNKYLWSTGDTTQSIAITLPGEYWVRVGINPCYNYDTITVDLIVLAVNLGPDTLLCPGGSITLHAGNPGANYLWNTGNTYQTLMIDRNGTFWVRVYLYQCEVSDTIHIDLMEQLVMPTQLNLCGHESLSLEAGIDADHYFWSTGETTQDILVTQAGTYSLLATKGHCNLTDSTLVIGKSGISTFYVPNSFTPDGDGLNEIFSAQGVDITYLKMTIFNRWGELLFESLDKGIGWDGKYKGEYVPGGEYVYVIQYANTCSFDQIFQKTGTVAVVR